MHYIYLLLVKDQNDRISRIYTIFITKYIFSDMNTFFRFIYPLTLFRDNDKQKLIRALLFSAYLCVCAIH